MAKQPTVLQIDIVDLWVQGMSNADIAAKLNCSVSAVAKAKADPDLRTMYYERQQAQIESLVPQAITRLTSLINDDKQQGAVHIAAVREVLDRSHLKELLEATQNKEVHIVVSYE